ncbi:MAG: T9SS type B sorting domain-containing protein, partial [Bacteroidetes bacterium]|nr:T9SS type B sorting domain-containing protein [Bacteroidota bacterium]
ITPNGDGKNDTWIIEGIEQYPKAQIFVYNRWGEVVLSAKRGYKNDWAGNYKNNRDLLPTGPYYYIIDFENDGRIDLSGWIYISD